MSVLSSGTAQGSPPLSQSATRETGAETHRRWLIFSGFTTSYATGMPRNCDGRRSAGRSSGTVMRTTRVSPMGVGRRATVAVPSGTPSALSNSLRRSRDAFRGVFEGVWELIIASGPDPRCVAAIVSFATGRSESSGACCYCRNCPTACGTNCQQLVGKSASHQPDHKKLDRRQTRAPRPGDDRRSGRGYSRGHVWRRPGSGSGGAPLSFADVPIQRSREPPRCQRV